MEQTGFSNSELKEFYSFLHKISNFEKIYQIQNDSVIFILWGAIFIISAISETFLNLTPGYKFPILIWFVALCLGGLLTITIENQVTFLRKKKFNFFDRQLLLVLSFLVLTILIFEIIFRLNYLLFPLFGLQFFFFSYKPTQNYLRENNNFVNSKLTNLIPISGLISSIISILVLLFGTNLLFSSLPIDPFYFSNFESLIFAIFVGPVLIISGLLNNKKINDYFLTMNTESE